MFMPVKSTSCVYVLISFPIMPAFKVELFCCDLQKYGGTTSCTSIHLLDEGLDLLQIFSLLGIHWTYHAFVLQWPIEHLSCHVLGNSTITLSIQHQYRIESDRATRDTDWLEWNQSCIAPKWMHWNAAAITFPFWGVLHEPPVTRAILDRQKILWPTQSTLRPRQKRQRTFELCQCGAVSGLLA